MPAFIYQKSNTNINWYRNEKKIIQIQWNAFVWSSERFSWASEISKNVSRIQWNFGYKIQTKRFAVCGGGQIWDNTASYKYPLPQRFSSLPIISCLFVNNFLHFCSSFLSNAWYRNTNNCPLEATYNYGVSWW